MERIQTMINKINNNIYIYVEISTLMIGEGTITTYIVNIQHTSIYIYMKIGWVHMQEISYFLDPQNCIILILK